jgi:hypothetical protein
MHGRVFRALSLAAVLSLLTVGAALADAGGQGTVTSNQQFRNTALFAPQPMTNPCTGAPGILTAIAKTAIFHSTTFTTGPETWITTTAEGTTTFTPDDPLGVVASGHFSEWFGVSLNNKNAVQHDTSTFQLRGTDGSHIVVQEVMHFGINANGLVTVSFDKSGVRCG